MLKITQSIEISEDELIEDFVRASGPGGQNVNKVASAVQLRFDARNSPAISDTVFSKLRNIAGKRMTLAGVIIISADNFRSQERNRDDAKARLVAMIQEAARPVKKRRTTRPTRASKERRIKSKKKLSQVKSHRRRPNEHI